MKSKKATSPIEIIVGLLVLVFIILPGIFRGGIFDNWFYIIFGIFWAAMFAKKIINVTQPTINERYQNHRSVQKAWRQFATRNNLNFYQGIFLLQSIRITGIYRGIKVKLEAAAFLPESHTHITFYDSNNVRSVTHETSDQSKTPITLTSLGFPTQPESDIYTWPFCRHINYKQVGLEQNPQYLDYICDKLIRLAEIYPQIIKRGGIAIPHLKKIAQDKTSPLDQVAKQLLEDIEQDSKERLGYRATKLFCPTCFLRFARHRVTLSWDDSITFFGCRNCQQSDNFFEGDVVAVLDNSTNETQVKHKDLFYINWLTHRILFDFDWVEIVQATDEEVERFAVKVGNDTDPYRKPRYETMHCVIQPKCRLSRNTLKILESMFGEVQYAPIP